MPVGAAALFLGVLIFGVYGNGGPLQGGRATALLRESAAAVAGDTEVRSLRLNGSIQNTVNGVTAKLNPAQPVEFRMVLFDGYLQIEQDSGLGVTRFAGFRGSELLNGLRTSDARTVGSTRFAPEQLDIERFRFGCLILGMLGRLDSVNSWRVEEEAARESGRLQIHLKGPTGTEVWLTIDPDTRLPLSLRYSDQVSFPKPLTPEQVKRGVMAPRPPRVTTEVTMEFLERPAEGEVRVPRLIRKTAQGVLLEEIRIQTVVVNPKLTDADFKTGR